MAYGGLFVFDTRGVRYDVIPFLNVNHSASGSYRAGAKHRFCGKGERKQHRLDLVCERRAWRQFHGGNCRFQRKLHSSDDFEWNRFLRVGAIGE